MFHLLSRDIRQIVFIGNVRTWRVDCSSMPDRVEILKLVV